MRSTSIDVLVVTESPLGETALNVLPNHCTVLNSAFANPQVQAMCGDLDAQNPTTVEECNTAERFQWDTLRIGAAHITGVYMKSSFTFGVSLSILDEMTISDGPVLLMGDWNSYQARWDLVGTAVEYHARRQGLNVRNYIFDAGFYIARPGSPTRKGRAGEENCTVTEFSVYKGNEVTVRNLTFHTEIPEKLPDTDQRGGARQETELFSARKD